MYFKFKLKLKFRKNESYHEKRTAHWHTVTSFLVSKSFYSQSLLFKHTNNFGSVFPDLLDLRITRPYSWHISALPLFPFFIPLNPTSLMLKTLCWWLQLCYHSTSLLLSAGAEKYRETLHTKQITITIFIFQAWNLYSYLKELDSLPSKKQDGWILKAAYFLENYIGTDTW